MSMVNLKAIENKFMDYGMFLTRQENAPYPYSLVVIYNNKSKKVLFKCRAGSMVAAYQRAEAWLDNQNWKNK